MKRNVDINYRRVMLDAPHHTCKFVDFPPVESCKGEIIFVTDVGNKGSY